MISERGRRIADEIDALSIGQTVHINDHEISRVDADTELYDVDGQRVGFVEAWEIVTCPDLENRTR